MSLCLWACGSDPGGDRDDDGDDPGGAGGEGPDGGDDSGADAAPPDGSADADSGVDGCVRGLFGRYIVREDGAPLYQSTGGQEPILDPDGDPVVGVTEVHDGYRHGCAVLGAAATAWCWRVAQNLSNNVGQLGNGTLEASGPLYRATQVLTGEGQPLENVASISRAEVNGSVDSRASCAVTTDGGLHCWGEMRWLVNDGTPLSSPYAIPITTNGTAPLSGVIQVAVYAGHACAVVAAEPSNQLWCWGQNGSGQLGLGDTIFRRYPTQVVGLDDPSRVVAQSYGGYPTTCALDDSRVRCWGENRAGQTGINSAQSPIFAPSLVEDMAGDPLTEVVDLHGGSAQFCALRNDRTIWCWGNRYDRYAAATGLPGIAYLGGTEAGPRYLTSDGVYHIATREPNCGELP
jgi:hypothetical protein